MGVLSGQGRSLSSILGLCRRYTPSPPVLPTFRDTWAVGEGDGAFPTAVGIADCVVVAVGAGLVGDGLGLDPAGCVGPGWAGS